MKKNIVTTKFIFLIPSLLFFLIFAVLPIILGFLLMFTSWDLINPLKWIGLSNFKKLLEDKWFWHSLMVSFKFTLITTPLVFVVALGLGLLLYREDKISRGLRAIFYWPYMTPVVVSATMWKWILSRNSGIVNYFLSFAGISPISWLTKPGPALGSVCAAQIWILSGFMMVIFITGLQGIPREVKEAALVDGVNKMQMFRYIIFPLLKNTNILVLILTIAYSFRSFSLIYVMTTGGPGYATTVTPLYIYQTAFTQFRIGYASAMSFVFLFITMSIAFFIMRLQRGEAKNA